MRLPLWVALLFISTPAFAQFTLTVAGRSTAINTVSFGPNDCNTTIPIVFTRTGTTTTQLCTNVLIWITPQSVCETGGPEAGDLQLNSVPTSVALNPGTQTDNTTVSALPFGAGDGGVSCGANIQQTFQVCGRTESPGTTGITLACGTNNIVVTQSNSLAITFDSQPPAPPQITNITPLDSSLKVDFTTNSDVTVVRLFFREAISSDAGTGAFSSSQDFTLTGGSGSGTITGLTNGVTYQIVGQAQDAAGNQSVLSDPPVEGTPIQTNGFFAIYRADGGQETGGCSSVGGSLLALLAVVSVAAFLMRKKGGALLLVLFFALPVRAQTKAQDMDLYRPVPPEGTVPPPYMGTPKSSYVELKIGTYHPLIAEESGVHGNPYSEAFGRHGMLMAQLEYDYQFFQAMGSLAAGLSAGYAEKYGHAVDLSGNSTAESTSLHVIPITVLLVYRFDYAALHWHVPLVPYAKAGLTYMPWWTSKGHGVEFSDGFRGAGGKWGYQGTGGLALMLDFLQPKMARDFDTDVGVNHSYLFAEYNHSNVNSFGAKGLNLSSRQWLFGVAIEF